MRSLIFTGACLLVVIAPRLAGSQIDPFALRATHGPYKTAEAAGHHIPANSPRKPEAAVFQSPNGGFFEALVLSYPGGIGTDSYLGLRTGRGWFYVETGYTKLSRQTAEQVSCTCSSRPCRTPAPYAASSVDRQTRRSDAAATRRPRPSNSSSPSSAPSDRAGFQPARSQSPSPNSAPRPTVKTSGR